MQDVIKFQTLEPGIVQLTMQDTAHKNTFSDALVTGLIRAFDHIKASNSYKVVILTGYGSYFSAGATKDGLLALANGQGQFTDTNIYSLTLDCPIPVISAMQGHGIGGGFVMGLFSDFIILSRESIYTTNFMKYGFTPGMGATYIVPKKLGVSLGHEMLLNAQTYRGETLKQRGIPFPVYPRNDVLTHALETAKQLAEKPRVALVTLKEHLVTPIRQKLPEIIKQELAMHEKTFYQQAVKERVSTFF
ncbi:polyketide synthase [Spartinivicinus poritis]|uniref:Polyketide synthase n=1 Tax=Spartinivicinus poritis TaxID=2994640 RepID=A0ABT5U872_9GAMM|nr:polyketide synthase [Spartinivicinus sp. A2-2]MDE1462563.1 polyketide synthase [Spartinivicinus sp. A2-2]